MSAPAELFFFFFIVTIRFEYREVKSTFCSGPGRTTNLVSFYVFLVLKSVDLSEITFDIEDGVTGDGTNYEHGTSKRQKTNMQEAAKIANIMSPILGHTLKAVGLNVAHPKTDEETKLDLSVKRETLAVKEKEGKALDQQVIKAKAESLKLFAECPSIPENLRQRALLEWAKTIGINATEDDLTN